MIDPKAIIKLIRDASNKDSNAYKVIEYYHDLTNSFLNNDRIALVINEILNIEKDLIDWIKNHPNDGSTIMQPEESAIILINDLRNRGILKLSVSEG